MVFRRLHNTLGTFYGGFKMGFSTVTNPVRKLVRTTVSLGNHVDTLLKAAEKIPIIGESAADLRASPEYHEILATIQSGGDLLDRVEKRGSLINKGVEFGLDLLDKNAGGEVDQALDGLGSDISSLFNQGRQGVRNFKSGLRQSAQQLNIGGHNPLMVQSSVANRAFGLRSLQGLA